MGIFEILLILVIALIVIPPDDLPQVMRTVGKVLRELRLASNTVMRELSSAIGDDSPFNLLPPRLDSLLPGPLASSTPQATTLSQSAPRADAPAPEAQAAQGQRPAVSVAADVAPTAQPAAPSAEPASADQASADAPAPAADAKP